MRILLMTDSPFIPSGQARVGREIAVGLAARGHQIGYLGWWHNPNITPNLPYNIQFWWTNDGMYGSNILDKVVNSFQPEILLTIGDFWNLAYITEPITCRTRKYFQWCSYIPVDGEPHGGGLSPGIADVIAEVDIPVAYTNYAKDAVLKSIQDQETRNRISVIYHGVDTKIFKPLDPAARRKMRESYGIDDKFIFLTVCRNQTRKNIPELFKAWRKFIDIPGIMDNVILWPHMNFRDTSGWNIDDLINIYGFKERSVMYYDQMAHPQHDKFGIPETELAALYQMADAFILLSNEGFGLPTLEAMATRLPCILLNHSASGELGIDGRALLVKPEGNLTWIGRYLTEKPIPGEDASVDAMVKVFSNKKLRDETASKGYEFAIKNTWDSVLDEWNALFLSYEMPFLKSMKMEVVV